MLKQKTKQIFSKITKIAVAILMLSLSTSTIPTVIAETPTYSIDIDMDQGHGYVYEFDTDPNVPVGGVTHYQNKAHVDVDSGGNVKIYYEENSHVWCLDSITLDGILLDISLYPHEYIFNNVQQNHTINIVYTKEACVIPLQDLDFTATSYSGTYDGNSYGLSISNPDGATVEYSLDGGATWTSTPPSATNVVDSLAGIQVKATKAGYNDELITGLSIAILPRAVTLTSASDTKVYDGTPLTNGTVDVTSGSFVSGEGFTPTVTGTQTAIGSSANAFTFVLNAGTLLTNYLITPVEGTLTVTTGNRGDDDLTVTDYSAAYDGAAHTVGVTNNNPLTDDEIWYSLDNSTWTQTLADVSFTNVTAATTVYVELRNPSYNTVAKSGTVTITKRLVTLTSASDTKVFDGTPLTNGTVTVTSGSFVSGEGFTPTVTGTQTAVGSSANAFTFVLNAGTLLTNYLITPVEGTLTVTTGNRGDDDLTVTDYSAAYDGAAHTVAATNNNPLTGDEIWYSLDNSTWTQTLADVSFTNVTAATTVYVELRNPSYNTVAKSGTVTITKRAVTLTSASDTKVFDGTPLTNGTVTVTSGSFVSGEGFTPTVTGTQTAVGSSANAFTYVLTTGTLAGNYLITPVEGTLTVTTGNRGDDDLTVTDYSAAYDGAAHTVTATNNNPLTGDEIWYSLDNSTWTQTLADVSFTNVTAATTVYVELRNPSYNTVAKSGTVTITKRAVTLTSASDTKVFDGTPLTNGTVTVTSGSFVSGEGFTPTVTGTQTAVGSSANAFTYVLTAGTLAGNYLITPVEGTLTVTTGNRSGDDLTVTSYGAVYDGAAHTVTATNNNPMTGDEIWYSLDNSTWTQTLADVSFTDVTATTTVYVELRNPSYNTVAKSGTVTITRRSVYLTSGSATKNYDGTPLTNSVVSISGYGFVTGEGLTFNVYGSQTAVGWSWNYYSFTYNTGTKSTNYIIYKYHGKLTVLDNRRNSDDLSVTDYSDVYDGEYHTVTATNTNPMTGDEIWYSLDNSTWTQNLADVSFDDVTTGSTVYVELRNPMYTTVAKTGTVTITPLEITIRARSNTWTYDGNPHTLNLYDVLDPLATDDELDSVKVSGSITNPGAKANEISDAVIVTYEGLTKVDKTGNYDITYKDGKLEILTAPTPTPTPTPSPSPTPTPPVPTPTPTVEPTPTPTVEPTPTPEPTDTPTPVVTEVPDDDTPEAPGGWALINLLAAIVSVILAGVLLATRSKDSEEDGEQVSRNNRTHKIVGVVIAIVSVVVFILTEDMRNPMIYVDNWTILMLVLALGSIIALYLGRREIKDESTNEPTYQ